MGLLKTDAAKAAWASASFNVEQNDAAKETAKAEKEAAKAEKADAKVARQAAKKEAKAEKVAEKAAAHLAEVTWIKIFNNVTGGLTSNDYYAVAESGVPEKDALNNRTLPSTAGRRAGGRSAASRTSRSRFLACGRTAPPLPSGCSVTGGWVPGEPPPRSSFSAGSTRRPTLSRSSRTWRARFCTGRSRRTTLAWSA